MEDIRCGKMRQSKNAFYQDLDFSKIAFRSSLVLGLVALVILVLYFSPLPELYHESCSRPCHSLDWPMICRIRLTLERFETLGSPCQNCPGNQSDCYNRGCITVDGQHRGILTANRQFPGPTLAVCQYDIVLVDVVNRIPGQSFGVHWRGQAQAETPYMDGVPMITQCPISSLTTYQYKFRASHSGTHVWQVNTGDEFLDTLFGPFIVRKPDSKETHKELYDTDGPDNVIVIHNWNPQRENYVYEDKSSVTKLLINGKTQEEGVPASNFKVSPGKRHRFRVIYMSGSVNCQIRFFIENHKFLVIALDGRSIKPKLVTSARMFPGERLDFVLKTDQKIASYDLKVKPVDCPNLLSTSASIQYEGMDKMALDMFDNEIIESYELSELKTTNDEDCESNSKNSLNTCLRDIESFHPMPEELSAAVPDVQLYFFYNSTLGSSDSVVVGQVNNVTMMLPSSPLISQGQEIRSDYFCNENVIPERCRKSDENVCECIHLVSVPLNAVVELVLVNQDNRDHVFHLHGYSFHVIGTSQLTEPDITPSAIKKLDSLGKLVRRNFEYPIVKDTAAVMAGSLVVLRFKADNPGYWMLDEEYSPNWFRGMSLVFKVGKKYDLSPVPNNFPRCGDWVGPEYFLA
ncbi:hypothetical protein RUM43_005823 [Polyplax serrata]|uniref:Uncharacterized protein n=1 Tax=Polyplax serrata TaxID=468196 RepID=A0AAN8S8S5_POLSC